MQVHPPRLVRYAFWLLLGSTSVILTEVVTFASPFPFLTAWGLLVVCPLYTLHVLVLAWLIFRGRAVSLFTLFLAGALLGLYEAYVTKVLWEPTWGDARVTLGGVYVVQTAILVLFYHPLMAFVLPLIACESLFTSSRETLRCLPKRLQRWLRLRTIPTVAILATYCALFHSLSAPSWTLSFVSSLASGVVFLLLAWWWLRRRLNEAYDLRSLLPDDREAKWLIALLLFGYLWQGILLRPEALPRTLVPHLTVWAMYLLFGGLLYLHLRRAPTAQTAVAVKPHACPSQRTIWTFWGVFCAMSAFAPAVKTAAGVVVLISFLLGIGAGTLLVLRSAVELLPYRPLVRAWRR